MMPEVPPSATSEVVASLVVTGTSVPTMMEALLPSLTVILGLESILTIPSCARAFISKCIPAFKIFAFLELEQN